MKILLRTETKDDKEWQAAVCESTVYLQRLHWYGLETKRTTQLYVKFHRQEIHCSSKPA